ncbi:hypothetical protein N2152v2_010113 [Parachlorella kessleri]
MPGTWSDLQLFLGFNTLFFLAGAAIQGGLIQKLDATVVQPPHDAPLIAQWWTNIYEASWFAVLVMVLGNDLPEVTAGAASQVFGVISAGVGLASFALVLTLVEHLFMDVLETNVKRGSTVYEEGHMVVLMWCESARDLGMAKRILAQVCQANRGREEGTTVVHREKLEMESRFRAAIPAADRHGTQFVFRQGSPLDPESLRMVAATKARAVLITEDYSRKPEHSDAQCVRAAVVLDEMVEAEYGEGSAKGPMVVVQAHTEDALRTLQYTCSDRVVPVPTSTVSAKRIGRVLRHPIIVVFSRMLTDFSSNAHGVINAYPELEGLKFKDLHARFPFAIVIGLINSTTKYCKWNPDPNRTVQRGDEVMMMRPGPFESTLYPPLEDPPIVDLGKWDPDTYSLASLDELPLGLECRSSDEAVCKPSEWFGYAANASTSDESRASHHSGRLRDGRGVYLLPLQYSNTLLPAMDLLICGWGSDCLMWELLAQLDHGLQPLPPGACVTLLNERDLTDLRAACQQHGVTRLCMKHIKADPRMRHCLASAVDIAQFQAAVVFCDEQWVEEHSRALESHRWLSQSELLRLDAEILQVQLNIRLLLEERGCHQINIVCECMSYTGRTRFEDSTRLPLGVIVNATSFAAKVLTQVAYEPRVMLPYEQLGQGSDLVVQDSSAFAAVGERLSYLQLQACRQENAFNLALWPARAASVHQVLMGYYRLPHAAGMPLEVVPTVFNRGDFRCKIVTMALTTTIQQATQDLSGSLTRTGEEGSASLEHDGSLYL